MIRARLSFPPSASASADVWPTSRPSTSRTASVIALSSAGHVTFARSAHARAPASGACAFTRTGTYSASAFHTSYSSVRLFLVGVAENANCSLIY
jgi:hypothetical protein